MNDTSRPLSLTAEVPVPADPLTRGLELLQAGGPVVALLVLMSICLLYTSPSPRDQRGSRMPSSA